MITQSAATPFPVMLVFPDVDPPVLVRDEGMTLDSRSLLDGAWMDYLRRVLPPVAGPMASDWTSPPRRRAGWTPERIRSATRALPEQMFSNS